MSFAQFLRLILIVCVVLMVSQAVGDPDLWGHVRFGQDMLRQHTVYVQDVYSFTANHTWINHEWLSEIAMAWAFQNFGAAGLNLLRVVVVTAVLLIAWYSSKGVPDGYRILIMGACALGIRLRAIAIRPQIFSLLFFAILMALIRRSDRYRTLRPLAVVPLLMALWVNFHGGWIVGLAVFGLWCLMSVVTETFSNRILLMALAVASLLATLANPYGLEMWRFLWRTVNVDRQMIGDWQPLYTLRYAPLWISWITALAVLLITTLKARSPVNLKHVVSTGLLGLAAIRVSRLDAFFALAATILATSSLEGDRNAIALETLPGRQFPALRWVFALFVVATSFTIASRLRTVTVASGAIPDFEVANYVNEKQLTGRVLIWFDWGEYVIWHFGPNLKVSIDGRRETIYDDSLVAAHMQLYLGEPGSWRLADNLKSDFVWLPKQLAIVPTLQEHGWRVLCSGESSILLTRRPDVEPCEHRPNERNSSFPNL